MDTVVRHNITNPSYESTLPAATYRQLPPASRSKRDDSFPESSGTASNPKDTFELLQPLGRGSYGSVYKANVLETGDIVAVKIIPLTDNDEIDSIQKEINILRDCNHPNIVRYYGSWRANDALWIAMEYCAGGSVSDIMQALGSPLEESVIAYICSETLNGLAYLHSTGRVHRDIKCGNILLTEDGEVKLADFGVAAQLTSTLSKRNTFIGTPHWMAPEVIQASSYDGKVDVWALGITAIEMAEMYPPRWRVNPNRVIFMVVRDPAPHLTHREKWTLAFQDFISQCLKKDSKSRPTTRLLQQHKFVGTNTAEGMRKILPAVARAKMAYLALAQQEGYQRSKNESLNSANHRFSGIGTNSAMSWDARGAADQQSATVVVNKTTLQPHRESANIEGTVIIRDEKVMDASTVQIKDQGTLGTESNYLKAIEAAASADLEIADNVNNNAKSPFVDPNMFQKKESSDAPQLNQIIERLYNIQSGGAVVPLPVLKATDIAPLAQIKTDLFNIRKKLQYRGILQERDYEAVQEENEWEADVLAVIENAENAPTRKTDHTPDETPVKTLPREIAEQVRSSPTILCLARALCAHKKSLKAASVTPSASEEIQAKIDSLTDTLTTILCL